MKKYLLLILGLIMSIGLVQGQALLKNSVSANFGTGFSGSSHTTYTFGIGYQREIGNMLFINLEYTDIQGSQSFKSLFGEVPKLSQYGEFGEGFQLNNGQEDYIFGRLIQISGWSLGLKKYIQLSPKIYMAAGMSVVMSGISEMEIKGITYDDNDIVNYDKAYPAYGTYNKIGGKVGFELLYNLKNSVNLVSKLEYFSFESIISLSVGTTVSF